MSHIQQLIKKRTEDLSFITLDSEAALPLKGYGLPPQGLDVPLLTAELAENIKAKGEDEVVTLGAILRGMLYTLGVDPDFLHREAYRAFLLASEGELKDFILVQAAKAAERQQWLESAIYLKGGLQVLEEELQLLFQYALALLQVVAETPALKPASVKAFRLEAIEALEQVVEAEPNPMADYHLAYLYKEEKQYVRAMVYGQRFYDEWEDEELGQQMALFLKELEDLVLYERGYEAVLAGKSAQGLQLLLPLEETYDKWWNLLFFIGLAYQQQGLYQESIGYFERVLELKPEQLDVLLEIALAHAALNRAEQAEEYYLEALRLAGDDPEVLAIVTAFYCQLGQLKKARRYVDRGLKQNPNHASLLAYQQYLQSQLNG